MGSEMCIRDSPSYREALSRVTADESGLNNAPKSHTQAGKSCNAPSGELTQTPSSRSRGKQRTKAACVSAAPNTTSRNPAPTSGALGRSVSASAIPRPINPIRRTIDSGPSGTLDQRPQLRQRPSESAGPDVEERGLQLVESGLQMLLPRSGVAPFMQLVRLLIAAGTMRQST